MVASGPFRFPGLLPENPRLCTIEATVTTGFEAVAAEECSKRFSTNVVRTRGRIGFDIEIDKIKQVLTLKCIDNISVLIHEVENMHYKETAEECLKQIQDTFHLLDWKKGLLAWNKMTDFDLPLNENIETPQEIINATKNLSFRVTCKRVGQKHKFQSPDASKVMGAIINDTFGWKVDLTKFDIEVFLNICDNYLYVGISLGKESLHKRNLEYFGPTTLRPTISHCMLRLACIEPGEIVCDPACGSGSIVVEGIVSWPHAFHICGDIHDVAFSRTKQNVDAITCKLNKEKCLPVNIFQWDATHLPMQDNSIDAIVTDLPFGKKMGNKRINRSLYPKLIDEFTRTVKVKTGRAIILTADRKQMSLVLRTHQQYWKVTRQMEVNIGGLSGNVFVLKRTAVDFRVKQNE